MNQNYIFPDKWSIIEEGFDPDRVKSSESLFSLGNGAMGQRANFEEAYSGESLQGSYIGGIYYPDKTKVGWWKNGYPEYFAKVLNAPNWIGINVKINGEELDLNQVEVSGFRRELNMREGWLLRSFQAELKNGTNIEADILRFLSLKRDELGAVHYQITPLNQSATIAYQPYIDSGVHNQDANWEESFWEQLDSGLKGGFAHVQARTFKTHYNVVTYMKNRAFRKGKQRDILPKVLEDSRSKITLQYTVEAQKGEGASLIKLAGYTVSTNHKEDQLVPAAKAIICAANSLGFDGLLREQISAWAEIWETADIEIEGDVRAQQGIRFNIYHLNQTYSGKDPRLNIGPKGFTGEKYGGSTYWDTEAYCLPFYMATKGQEVGRNLLAYRYNHLQKAMENAEKLGFSGGAALYPMVTMNGEESHNEWEITFEEIHRNGAIAFAIHNYIRYTGDYGYIPEKGLEVLIGIARFWRQRANFSKPKNQYVILGVTGPNEYENNVQNNFHTNYIAKWCLEYTLEQLNTVKKEYPSDYKRIRDKTNLSQSEPDQWETVAEQLYLPFSEKHSVYLQQDGFLDKEILPVADLDQNQRPLNQTWSWDRILRSPYIKQADTLQSFYFFEDHFTKEELEKHFDFYEPLTVHESSLSPCVHSIQAAKLSRMEKAYELYLRTSRLDIDDYNQEVGDGLHITSMAGTWLSVVEGFGGMRVKDNTLSFSPQLPQSWNSFSFNIQYRGRKIKVQINQKKYSFTMEGEKDLEINVYGKSIKIPSNGETVTI